MNLTAVIERASDGGYGIYLEEVDGVAAVGYTEDEAIRNLNEVIELLVDDCAQCGIADGLNGGNIKIGYKYDGSCFRFPKNSKMVPCGCPPFGYNMPGGLSYDDNKIAIK